MRPMSVEIAKAVLNMTDDEAEEFIVHNTTAKAYENLINGTADLIFVSEPSDDILNSAREAGVEFEMVGIGRDGFVFVVNQDNPVESLTIEQIQKIYTGEIKNWSEVGGEDVDIIAYQREPNSGSQNLMEKMVMRILQCNEVVASGFEMFDLRKERKLMLRGRNNKVAGIRETGFLKRDMLAARCLKSPNITV